MYGSTNSDRGTTLIFVSVWDINKDENVNKKRVQIMDENKNKEILNAFVSIKNRFSDGKNNETFLTLNMSIFCMKADSQSK